MSSTVEPVVSPAVSALDEDARKPIVNRLKRASGQLIALIAAIEADASCRDIVTQLSAVSSAVDRAGFMVISTALKECLENPDKEGGYDVKELEKMFMSLA